MHFAVRTRTFKVALASAALVVMSFATVGSASAQIVQQGLGVSKGCEPSTPVGSPYICDFGFSNNPFVNPSNNTLFITSVSDTVFAAGGNSVSGNELSSLQLVITAGSPTCNGTGTGTAIDPFVGMTSCTLPANSGLATLSGTQSHYTVTNADFGLSGHVLADQVSVIWHATCDVTPNCSTANSTNQAVGQTTITPGSPAIVTSATPSIAVGQTAQDSATISGLLGNAPDGNIVFTLFGPEASPTCDANDLVFTSGQFHVTANGTYGPATSPALTTPGSYFWVATYTDTNGSNGNVATPCGDANETTVVIQPDANIQITPAEATNPVGSNHTLTGHVNVSDDGVTFTNAPAGTEIDFTIVSGPGTFVGGTDSCLTIGTTGSCTVQITSATTGDTVVNASTTVTVNSVVLTRSTGDAHAGDSENAVKHWVQPDANIQITPATADNPTNTNHTLTGHVNVSDDGVTFTNAPAGTEIDFTIVSGPGSFVGGIDSCLTIGTTGSCTVQITSAVGGTTVIRASTDVTVNSVLLHRETNDGHTGDSVDAQKTWHPPVTGGIFPTQTSCSDFKSGTAQLLPGINYSVSGGKIGQNINPGVFFYFSTVTTTVPNQVVTTSQSTDNSSGALFTINQGHAWLWTSDCASKLVGSLTNSGSTASFTVPTPGTYIIQVQYQTKSIAGTAAPNPINPTYTFDTDGVDNATIQLFKK